MLLSKKRNIGAQKQNLGLKCSVWKDFGEIFGFDRFRLADIEDETQTNFEL